MADKKKATEGSPADAPKAAGKKVKKEKAAAPEAAVEAAPPVAAPIAPRMKSMKIPKLAKKNKSRLPRREKKARQKAL